MLNRYTEPPTLLYSDLLSLVQDKDYFVITTNVDHCFQKAGFDKKPAQSILINEDISAVINKLKH